jgi:hypothetical protein
MTACFWHASTSIRGRTFWFKVQAVSVFRFDWCKVCSRTPGSACTPCWPAIEKLMRFGNWSEQLLREGRKCGSCGPREARPPLTVGVKMSWLQLATRSTLKVMRYLPRIGTVREIREYCRRDPSHWPHDVLYPQKLALISPTNGGRSVGIVRSRTKATVGTVPGEGP